MKIAKKYPLIYTVENKSEEIMKITVDGTPEEIMDFMMQLVKKESQQIIINAPYEEKPYPWWYYPTVTF